MPSPSDTLHYKRGEDHGWYVGDRRATADEIAAVRPKCPSGGRHWFTVYGCVGMKRPTCNRCDAPNPRITAEEVAEYEAWCESYRRALRGARR